jgi:signal transduction histidine kinase
MKNIILIPILILFLSIGAVFTVGNTLAQDVNIEITAAATFEEREAYAQKQAELRRNPVVHMAAQEQEEAAVHKMTYILPVTGNFEVAFIVLVSFGLGLFLPTGVAYAWNRIKKKD